VNEQELKECERKVMRKIHDPIKIKVGVGERTNEEMDLLIKPSDMGRSIQAQRMRWIGANCKNG
jgi:hypothetical protein